MPPVIRPAVEDPTGRFRQPRGRGPNGRRLCRWCHQEVPAGRRSRCSAVCAHSYDMRVSASYRRQWVWRRDHGVCSLCGLDTDKLKRILRCAKWGGREEVLALLGNGRRFVVAWEADHIHPRYLGGSDELDNLRTLCVECHKAVSRQQAGERAARLRGAEAAPKLSGP